MKPILKALLNRRDLAYTLCCDGARLLERGHSKRAAVRLKAAVLLMPNYGDAHILLGAAYGELGQLGRARRSSERGAELRPDRPAASQNLAEALRLLGDLDGALISALSSVRIAPGDPQSHVALGEVWNALGKADAAIAAYKRAIELNPTNLTIHLGVANIYRNQGNSELAIRFIEEAVTGNPQSPEVDMALGLRSWFMGDYSEAAQHFRRTGDGPGLGNLGWCLLRCGDVAGAIDAVKRAVTLYPKDLPLLYLLARAYAADNDLKNARVVMETAHKVHPSSLKTVVKLAQIRLEIGDRAGAAKAYQKAAWLDPQNADRYRV